MVTFGLDISHHQDLRLDLAQCRREGIEFVFIKATEGSSFVDSAFAANLAEARAAGQLVAAYHYVRSNASAAAQVANVQRAVPRDVPVIPDVEANSGGIALTRDFINALRGAGYAVPLLYLPRWYWQQIGSPSLAGLPPLWSSRYPDTVVGTISDEWADVPATYWNGYGGLSVAVLQFTSSARIAGHQPLDANAFPGDRAQLAALLGGKEDDVSLSDEFFEFIPPGETAVRRVKAIDALANLYIERFYGSGTAPWTGPSGRALDLGELATKVDLDYDKFVSDVVDRLASRLGTLRFDATATADATVDSGSDGNGDGKTDATADAGGQ